NMAAIWDLPVIYVCENNMYATEVPFNYATRNTEVAERARSYGIPGVAVDGNDVLAVYEVAAEAVQRARSGHGPSLIECKTYRTRPHAEGMRDAGYRTAEEIEDWKTRNPIDRLADSLVSHGSASDADIEAVQHEVTEMVAEALQFATDSPYPDPDTATKYIYGK
ncbi:MAG TPA: thiamine pyrophosphate-dependent enzyme, partial [Thermomicrobiales bacterium]|nr:thiamine pyrophosphate-dependent enzyme [Thermomicrobiales bacterium]